MGLHYGCGCACSDFLDLFRRMSLHVSSSAAMDFLEGVSESGSCNPELPPPRLRV